MSAGDIDDEEANPSELIRCRRESGEFHAYLDWAWRLKPIRTFFIPFAAGISEDGRTIYISHDIQTYFEGIELESALARHETTEWGLRRYLSVGEEYSSDPIGHRIANNAEFDRVRQLLDRPDAIKSYEEWMDPQVFTTERTNIKGKPIPRDLALYPYEDDVTLCDELEEEMWNERSVEEWERLHGEVAQQPPPKPLPTTDTRLTRDAFVYLDPKPPENEFAQCSTCRMWVPSERCSIHGPDVKVTGGMSCALYIHGEPLAEGTETSLVVTPAESGLVDRKVRCENCRWGGPTKRSCELFNLLNHTRPDIFNLNVLIDPKGCCNAQEPRGRETETK
jgi:hypothetical protein